MFSMVIAAVQATPMLNHPGESLIFHVDFLDMVNRVNICIAFSKSHVRTFGTPSKLCCTYHFCSNAIAKQRSIYLDSSNV